jgi:hypothetical protein
MALAEMASIPARRELGLRSRGFLRRPSIACTWNSAEKVPTTCIDDTDLQKVVTSGVRFIMVNAGQICSVPSRMAEVLKIADRTVEEPTVGRRIAAPSPVRWSWPRNGRAPSD